MQIELAEFSQKLQEYRAILERLQSEKQSYQQRRERLSKLSQRRRSEIRKPDVVCYMCNANIEVEDTNSFATCRGCERLVCRSEEKQCCEWIPAIGIWECRNCHSSRVIQQKAGEWLLNQLTSRLQNPGPVNLNSEGLLGLTDSDDARSCTSSISSNQKVKVREFIEELLSSLLNGPLDDVSVGQLMENESYLKVFHRYHSRLSRCLYNLELSIHQSLSDLPLIEGQTEPSSPSDTHFELRKMLQKILDEVAKLPGLLNHSGFPLRPEEHLPYFSPKKYEQLLATAVLNKVVEDYRNPKNFEHVKPEADTAGPPTTGATSAGSAPATTGTTFDINHNKVPGESLLNEANLRKMSLDELKEELYNRSLSESDESYLSDYIQKHTVPLPDLSDTTGSGPEDDVISLKSNTTDGTWEENWLFKKRQLKSTESSIAMLVPSPTEEVKALIGDKNADEVSDLSEAGSDVEEYDSDSNVKNTDTGSSPKKAGNSLDDHAQDSLISINSIASNEPVLSEAKNDLLLQEQTVAQELHNNMVNDLISIEPCSIKTEAANPTLIENKSNPFLSGPESVLIEENNNIVKPDEVETDDIKLMQERIQNTPKQCDVDGNVVYPIGIARTIPVDGHSSECDRKEVPIDRAQSETVEKQKPSETSNGHVPAVATNGDSKEDSAEDEMLIPGSIAEREHLKWRNASPIANNPYSPDVLQKRLEESNRKSSLFDFDRLAGKDPTSPTLEVPDDSDLLVDSKEEEDTAEQDRSLQSVLGANPNQYQRYGRDYYINDAKRACGSRKQTPDLPTQLTHSTDDEKVSQQSYFLSTNSYIMNRFLNNDHTLSQSGPTSASPQPPVSPQPPPSLRSNRSLPRQNRTSPRPASVDLGYFTKASSNADSEVDIPPSIISQFEQEMLHSDFKRDSFRARNSSTRQFVLNPIFDESSSNTIQLQEDSIEPPEKSRTLPRSSASKPPNPYLSVPSQVSPVVETVFTDLGTLRRSTSVRSRTEDNSRPVVHRSSSFRSNISK